MRKLARSILLLSLTLLAVQPGVLFVPRASAATPPKASSKDKSKKKIKQHKYKKLKILKGRHGKHKARPA